MNRSEEKYCESCGQIIFKAAEICPKCGVRVMSAPYQVYTGAGGPGKDWTVALLLCIFLGWLGIHRFYTGHTFIGILQLFTFGGCGVWNLIDFILIILGSFRDGNGQPLIRKM